MLHALIITLLVFGADDKLKAAQNVVAYESAIECSAAAKRMNELLKAESPGGKIVIGCVPIEKPVRS